MAKEFTVMESFAYHVPSFVPPSCFTLLWPGETVSHVLLYDLLKCFSAPSTVRKICRLSTRLIPRIPMSNKNPLESTSDWGALASLAIHWRISCWSLVHPTVEIDWSMTSNEGNQKYGLYGCWLWLVVAWTSAKLISFASDTWMALLAVLMVLWCLV